MRPDIPVEHLPPCWSDDVRMNALFAPFRLKAANPESWEMKMKFWSDMTRVLCRSRGDPVVSAADVKVAFQRMGRTPACIDIVIEEMYRNGELVPLSKYQQVLQNGPEGWVRWGARLAFKPAAFALTAVSSLLPTRHIVDNDGLPRAGIESTQKFVLESVLKERATNLLDTYPAGLERVGTMEEVMARCQWPTGRDAFEMALGCLVLRGEAAMGEVVKLAEPNAKVTPITESDTALVKLTCAETRLEGDATRLSRDMSQAERDARAALALGNRLAAKNHLRRKHKAASRLERCAAALDNVKQLLQQMRDVTHNLAIVDTYKTATEAMKRGMKENNMDEDAVHDTMDDLKEVMDSYNEIEKAISGAVVDEDSADLEAELKELLAGPGDGDGGNATEPRTPTTTPKKTPRKESEREFVFDGEERILAELNELGVEDSSPAERAGSRPVRLPVAEWSQEDRTETPKANKSWYPPSSEWNNNFAEIRQDDRIHPGQPLNIDYSSPPRLYGHEFQVRDHKLDGGVWLFNSGAGELTGTEYNSSESPGKTGSNFKMAPGCERRKEPSRNQPETDGNQPDTLNRDNANQQRNIRNHPANNANQPANNANQPANNASRPANNANQPDDDTITNMNDLERRLKNLRGFKL